MNDKQKLIVKVMSIQGKIAKKLQNLNYFLIMKYNRPLLYRLLKGFITEQERNGVKIHSRVVIKDSVMGDLEIKDATFLEGVLLDNNRISSVTMKNNEIIRVDD